MNASPEVIAEAQRWIEKAENDFRNAEYVLTMEEGCPFDTVAYHCQQCVEKYVKAILVHEQIIFPRTHDLVVLRNLLAHSHSIHLALQDVQPLNRYAVESRYPGDWEYIDANEARAAFEKASRVRAAVRHALAPLLSNGIPG